MLYDYGNFKVSFKNVDDKTKLKLSFFLFYLKQKIPVHIPCHIIYSSLAGILPQTQDRSQPFYFLHSIHVHVHCTQLEEQYITCTIHFLWMDDQLVPNRRHF